MKETRKAIQKENDRNQRMKRRNEGKKRAEEQKRKKIEEDPLAARLTLPRYDPAKPIPGDAQSLTS